MMTTISKTLRLFCVLMVMAAFFNIATASIAIAQESPPVSLLVKFQVGLSPAEQMAIINENGGVEISSIPALRLRVIEVPSDQLSTILQKYQMDTRVERVEENKVRKIEAIPSDPDYGDQWALPKIGWDLVYGNITPVGTAKVAVLDTGVDASHEDLAGKVISGTSILDGSDGMSDPHGHGTWLAGIVAANTGNGLGIAGVGYAGVQIMPVTVLGADGLGQDSDIIAGILWAVDNGADVILMGFSNPDFSSSLQDAIDYAWSRNVVLVASAGNDGQNSPTYPAGMRGVIGVSATDHSDNLASFSNYGQAVFLAAPGVDIVATDVTEIGSEYPYITGSSTSAAIVAGVAAFMKAVDPTLTNGIIVGRLARTADPAGTDEQTGNGRINMARALEDTSTEPIQPAGIEGGGGPYVGPYKIAAPKVGSVSVGTQSPNPVTAGNSATYTITVNRGTGSGAFDADLSITTTLPTGASYSFSPIRVSFTPFQNSRTSTLTISTTVSTPEGLTSFTVKASTSASDFATNTGTLNVSSSCTPPSITTQPSNQTVTYGSNAFFTATASGDPAPTLQWQVNTGSGFTDIPGATSSPLIINSPTVAMTGNQYRAVFTNTCSPFTATSNAATLTVNKANQTITVTKPAPTSAVYNTSFDVAATASSGLPVAITVTGVGSGSGSGSATITMTSGTGTATVHYNQAGDDNYNAATEVTESVTAQKANQTITFGSLSDKTAGDPPFDVSATASSGLTVSFSSLTELVCTVSGNTVTLTNLAGTCTIRASQGGDTNYDPAPNVDRSFNVLPGPAVAFSVTAPASTIAGAFFSVTVTAKDQYNNIATGYTGTIQFTTSDINPLIVLPSNYTFVAVDNGSKTFTDETKLITAGDQTITATDTLDSSILGISGTIDVDPSVATKFTVTAPASTTAGADFSVIVTAKDTYDNVATGYVGTITFTSSDTNTAVVLPADYTFVADDNGTKTFTNAAKLITAGTQTITATDTVNSITADSGSILVIPGPAVRLGVVASKSTVTAFESFDVTVTAYDAYDNVATGYTGTVHFTSTDGLAELPGDYTFTTGVSGDNGIRTFTGVILKTGGIQTVTATDSSITGTSQNIIVMKAKATLTLSDLTHTYDGTAKSATVTTNPAGLTVVSITYAGSTTPPTNAGSYAVVATLDNPSYEADPATGTLKINQKDATVTASDASKTYGDPDPALATTNSGFLDGDLGEGKITFSASRASGESAGTYAITPSASDNSTGLLNNYNVTYNNGTFTINKKDASVTADNKSKTYGDDNPTLTATVTGTVNGDTLNYSLSTTADKFSNVGDYPIIVTLGSNPNYNVTKTDGTLKINQKDASVTADNKSKTYGEDNPTLTATVVGQVSGGDVINYSLSTTATKNSPVGSYTITVTLGSNPNYNVTKTDSTLTISQASTTTTAMTSASSVRYKDEVTLSAKIVPLNTGSPLTGSVSFMIGSGNYGSANAVPIPGDSQGALQATVVVQVSELPSDHNYTVTAIFTSTNANYSGSTGTTSLKVIPRNASPYLSTGFYTGDVFAWTTGQSSSTATVTLTAMIKDKNTPTGDIRAAKVTFYFVNGTTLTPIGGAKDLPVGLIDITDGTVGTASAVVQLNIGSANAQNFQIVVGISGGYTNNPWEALSGSIVTVAKPIPGGFIVGGGNLLNSASSGLIKGANGQLTDFSFDVQYNKSLTNPQGKVKITIRSYYKSNGILDSILHTYIITSNAISLLSTTRPTASFSSKANVVEQLPDGTLVNIEGGTVLQLSMTDSTNKLAITVQRKAGGLWFSSNWDSTTGKTVEQEINGTSELSVR